MYQGHISYDDINEKNLQPVGSFDSSEADGYVPAEVAALARALGGRAVTI